MQKYLDISKLNRTGSPDDISKLFFGLKFKIYSTSFFSFYSKIDIKSIEHLLRNRNPKEVFMITFKFNPYHLYVYNDATKEEPYNLQKRYFYKKRRFTTSIVQYVDPGQ